MPLLAQNKSKDGNKGCAVVVGQDYNAGNLIANTVTLEQATEHMGLMYKNEVIKKIIKITCCRNARIIPIREHVFI